MVTKQSQKTETSHSSLGAVRYQLTISALEAIVDPIGHMRKHLKEDENDYDEDDFECCGECNQPDACADFGCGIKQGLKEPNEW